MFVKALPGLIGLWVFSMTVQAFLSHKFQVKFNKPLFLLLIFYFFYVIGLLWTEDKTAGLFALEVKFSLFLFPLIIGTSQEFFKQNFIKILLTFIFGCLVSSIVGLSVAFYDSIFFTSTGILFNPIDPEFASWEFGGSHFRYINLSLFMHPTYFSLYLLFALIGSLFILRNNILEDRIFINGLYAAIPFFLLMIYLLSSKAVIICTLILMISYAVNLFKQKGIKRIKFAIVFIIIAWVGVSFQNSRFSTISEAISNPEILEDSNKGGSFVSRVHIWKAGFEIAGKNFLTGVGPGDTNDELAKKYELYHFKDPLRKKANAHNQYLETFIDLGIIGFLMLLSVLFCPIRKSVKEKNVLFLTFLFITSFNFLFETMLNTQAGVIFFGFFYSLLSIIRNDDVEMKTPIKIFDNAKDNQS